MFKNIAALAMVGMASYGFAKYYETSRSNRPEVIQEVQKQTSQAQNVAVNQQTQTPREKPLSGRKARIKMDDRGHFVTDARMNGRRVPVLVDTGATSVAINKTTARKMGIRLSSSDFKYTVNTANGQTKAATAVIKRIEIGRVRVNNVRAMVLDDKSLKGTLLGMTFLGELRSFGVKNRQLILEQ